MKLGTNFRFAKVDETHVNREAWDERHYTFNAWDANEKIRNCRWDEYRYHIMKNSKLQRRKQMTTFLILIGIIGLMLWAGWY